MRTTFLTLTTLVTTLVTPAAAQEPTEPLLDEEVEELVEPIRRYSVELIIFSYSKSVSAGTEVWIQDKVEAADASGSNGYFDELGERPAETEPAATDRYMDIQIVPFGKDDYTMTEIYNKLVRLDAYKPLVRTGWTQKTHEKDVTGPIELTSLAKVPRKLNGNLTLYLGRYLHLLVDLTMDADRALTAEPDDAATAAQTFGDSRVQQGYDAVDAHGGLLRQPVQYRIFEDRIMKNGDIRYFDHPKFGVIAKITRFEEPDDEALDDTDDLLPGGQLSP